MYACRRRTAELGFSDGEGGPDRSWRGRDLFEKLLPDQIKVLGQDHPKTLETRNNLAICTGDAGDPAMARDLFKELLSDHWHGEAAGRSG